MTAELTGLDHSVWEALACRTTPSLITQLRSNGMMLNHIGGQNIKRYGETSQSKRLCPNESKSLIPPETKLLRPDLRLFQLPLAFSFSLVTF